MDDWKLDNNKLLALFREFGFKTLTERVKKLAREIESSKQISLL